MFFFLHTPTLPFQLHSTFVASCQDVNAIPCTCKHWHFRKKKKSKKKARTYYYAWIPLLHKLQDNASGDSEQSQIDREKEGLQEHEEFPQHLAWHGLIGRCWHASIGEWTGENLCSCSFFESFTPPRNSYEIYHVISDTWEPFFFFFFNFERRSHARKLSGK